MRQNEFAISVCAGARRTLYLAMLAAGLACGCQYLPNGRTAALESQNESLVEQSKAQLAELDNLRVHGRRMEDDLRRAEEDLGLLDEELSHNRQQLASYQRERDAMLGVAGRRSGLPAGISRRLTELAQRYPSLEFDPDTGISKLDTDVLFDTADASIRPEGEKLLRDFAGIFQQTDARDLKIMVVGHTDSRAIAKKPSREREKNRRVEIFVMGPETPVVGWSETTPGLY